MQEVGYLCRLPGDPIAQPVELDYVVMFEQARQTREPSGPPRTLLHTHCDGRGALRRPVDLFKLADAVLKLVQLDQVGALKASSSASDFRPR